MSSVSIEDFMTPEELVKSVEQSMAERTDDLLVLANIEPRRHEYFNVDPYGIGMLFCLREAPRVNFKIEIYPNEIEEPHFKVIYQNETCRFKIVDCMPMKSEATRGIPTQINKIMKHVKKAWAENHDDLVKVWQKTRPSDRNLPHQNIK